MSAGCYFPIIIEHALPYRKRNTYQKLYQEKSEASSVWELDINNEITRRILILTQCKILEHHNAQCSNQCVETTLEGKRKKIAYAYQESEIIVTIWG